MELHKLLLRQLKRTNINLENLPLNLGEWQRFIESVNKKYIEEDLERYLLERSMDISSRELSNLNIRLETAQDIARIGSWLYDTKLKKITISRGTCNLLDLNNGLDFLNDTQFLAMLYPEDRLPIQKLFRAAALSGEKIEYELRMPHATGDRWYFIIAQSLRQPGGNYHSFAGIIMDVSKRKIAEEEVFLLNSQLAIAERYAGMADIATSTLHNVGNILNSANVSFDLLREITHQSARKKLYNVAGLLQKNLPTLIDYLSQDPQGKLIPEYLIALIENTTKEDELIINEIENLGKHIDHIQKIIVTQNDMSRTSRILEKVSLPQVVEMVLSMSMHMFDQHKIKIEKIYQSNPSIITDKIKLMQILSNIIQNSQDALIDCNHEHERLISIIIDYDKFDKKVIIKIKDNGHGILPEDLTKIFSLRFTTKEKGHGFGLHMCAVDAQAMGGSLIATSDGAGKGATFILTLPEVANKDYF